MKNFVLFFMLLLTGCSLFQTADEKLMQNRSEYPIVETLNTYYENTNYKVRCTKLEDDSISSHPHYRSYVNSKICFFNYKKYLPTNTDVETEDDFIALLQKFDPCLNSSNKKECLEGQEIQLKQYINGGLAQEKLEKKKLQEAKKLAEQKRKEEIARKAKKKEEEELARKKAKEKEEEEKLKQIEDCKQAKEKAEQRENKIKKIYNVEALHFAKDKDHWFKVVGFNPEGDGLFIVDCQTKYSKTDASNLGRNFIEMAYLDEVYRNSAYESCTGTFLVYTKNVKNYAQNDIYHLDNILVDEGIYRYQRPDRSFNQIHAYRETPYKIDEIMVRTYLSNKKLQCE